jgi:hypothetical protein
MTHRAAPAACRAVIVTVEQLLNVCGDVVASTELD